jgi:hypothetical protein
MLANIALVHIWNQNDLVWLSIENINIIFAADKAYIKRETTLF